MIQGARVGQVVGGWPASQLASQLRALCRYSHSLSRCLIDVLYRYIAGLGRWRPLWLAVDGIRTMRAAFHLPTSPVSGAGAAVVAGACAVKPVSRAPMSINQHVVRIARSQDFEDGRFGDAPACMASVGLLHLDERKWSKWYHPYLTNTTGSVSFLPNFWLLSFGGGSSSSSSLYPLRFAGYTPPYPPSPTTSGTPAPPTSLRL